MDFGIRRKVGKIKLSSRKPYASATLLDSPAQPGYPSRATDESPYSQGVLGSKPQGMAIRASSRCCLWAVICRKSLTLWCREGVPAMDADNREPPPPQFAGPPPPSQRSDALRIGKIIVIILVVIAAIAGASILCNSAPDRDTPTSERITSRATDTLAPTRTRRPQPTATRLPLPAPRGIGLSRGDVQSALEPGFVFDPPNVRGDGMTYVWGYSTDGLAFIELVGPAHNLQQAFILVSWPDIREERIPGAVYLQIFSALAAPTWDYHNWLPNNIENAMLQGEVATKHRGLRITLGFFHGGQVLEEFRSLSLLIEPDG